MIFLTIHEVLLPHTTKTISFRADAHPFQNDSNSDKNPERGASIHGSSSRKTTFLPSGRLIINRLSSLKASPQLVSSGVSFCPCSLSARRKRTNCFLAVKFAAPVNWKSNRFSKVSLIRKVLPTRRLPYTATNCEYSS